MNYTEKSQYFESESNELKEFHCHDSTNSTIDEICKNQTEDLNAEIVYLQNKVMTWSLCAYCFLSLCFLF